MLKNNQFRWTLLIIANLLFCCVLGFYEPSSAAQKKPAQPFANSVQQRAEMIQQLKLLNAQLKLQNQLLISGKVKVVVTQQQKAKPK